MDATADNLRDLHHLHQRARALNPGVPAGYTLTAQVTYTINSPTTVSPFNIRLGLDRDATPGIDSAAVLLATFALYSQPGIRVALADMIWACFN